MSEQIDVLAVMRDAAISLSVYPTSGPKPTEQMKQAIAAVTDLIEAAHECAKVTSLTHFQTVDIRIAELREAVNRVRVAGPNT